MRLGGLLGISGEGGLADVFVNQSSSLKSLERLQIISGSGHNVLELSWKKTLILKCVFALPCLYVIS